MTHRIAVLAALAIGARPAASVRAQSIIRASEGRPRPAFEIASVKPIDRATMHRDHEGSRIDGDIFIDRTNLLQFIVHAYISGGSCTIKTAIGEDCPLITGNLPGWVKTDRFEIRAKPPAGSLPNYSARQLRNGDTLQLNLMLQVVLEDRFHLKVHRETRDIPVFALTVGKRGPKFGQTPENKPVERHGLEGMNRVPGPDGAPRMRLTFRASSMQEVAAALASYFDRPVVDRTRLKGDYDLAIEYEEDQTAFQPATSGNTSGLGGNFINPYTGLSSTALSAALQDIGLRLESTKAPVEVLVVDRVERPSEN